MSDKKQITISSVKTLLEQGYTRQKIKEHFQITGAEMKMLFSHPKLEKLKARRVPNIEIVDDEEPQDASPVSESTDATTRPEFE